MAVQCRGCGTYTVRSTWAEGRGHLCPTCTAVSLDAAWAEAEAALPDDPETGWRQFAHLTLERKADGIYWAMAEVPGDVGVLAEAWSDTPHTPAAALRALAAKLRERADLPSG